MCGIIGYVGRRQALPVLLEGLQRLEYRGYDSAGIALAGEEGRIDVRKRAGKVSDLMDLWRTCPSASTVGIGHTRWATHGEPTDRNAHPHLDCTGTIAVIHNGVIENFRDLRNRLEAGGHTILSDTDTEVIAHLIENWYDQTDDLFQAVRLALQQVEGTYGLVVMNTKEPHQLIAARNGSPLVLGLAPDETIVASDASAFIKYTKDVTYLADGEVAAVSAGGIRVKTLEDLEVDKDVERLLFDLEQVEKGGFPHFMLKEIHEQPETILNALRGRVLAGEGNVRLGGLEHIEEALVNAKRIVLIGCGTSWHAALVGEYMLEQVARIPVEVEYASEFRYRDPLLSKDDLVFVISQSGETADTLAALREGKRKGATVLGIVNAVGSTIARETHGGIYVHAGPEIGVASTKAFTSQLTALALLAIALGRMRGMPTERGVQLTSELCRIPEKVGRILKNTEHISCIAGELKNADHFLYLGRGPNFPVALEGALKMKEISYIHAEGYPAAEMKHGPIALIDENMPVVFVAPRDATYEKIVSNMQEVRARKGRIIAVANEDDAEIGELAEYVLPVPRTLGIFGPILNVIPLQLLSYFTASARGLNVDQPRNLAKSVTVE